MRIQLSEPQPLRNQPTHDAGVVAELAAGAKLKVDGFRTENGEQWLSIALPSGVHGFLPEKTQFEPLSHSDAELSVMLTTAAPQLPGKRAIRNMVIGGGWLLIGLVVLLFTWYQAWIGSGSGTVYFLWGAIAFGAIRLTLGIFQYRRGE